jgi:hypothetical protein
MMMLWKDATIQAVLDHQKLRLQDMPGLWVARFSTEVHNL